MAGVVQQSKREEDHSIQKKQETPGKDEAESLDISQDRFDSNSKDRKTGRLVGSLARPFPAYPVLASI